MAASEFSLIERYLAAQRLERADVVLGIGDDGALLSPMTARCCRRPPASNWW